MYTRDVTITLTHDPSRGYSAIIQAVRGKAPILHRTEPRPYRQAAKLDAEVVCAGRQWRVM